MTISESHATVAYLTRAVGWLTAVLLTLPGIALAVSAEPLVAVALAWTAWIGLQVFNYRLTKAGIVAERFEVYRSPINSPNFVLRIVWHLLHNWSAVGWMTLMAFIAAGDKAVYLAQASIPAIAFVWIWFNWQHRRFNRLRNIAFTSALACFFLGANLWLLS